MSRLVRLALFVILAWAAGVKLSLPLGGPTIYESWTAAYPMLRYLVPCVELALGLWLLSGWRSGLSSTMTLIMLSAFSGLLVVEFTKEHPRPCGCLGAVAALYEPAAIRRELVRGFVRNILMIAGLAYVYLKATWPVRVPDPR